MSKKITVGTHTHENGHTHSHSHSHEGEEGHGHHHSPNFKRNVTNRLSRATGHLNKVKDMVEKDYDCCEVLVQLLAVKAALDSTGKYILKEHTSHCIMDAVKEGNYEAVEELEKLIDSFMK